MRDSIRPAAKAATLGRSPATPRKDTNWAVQLEPGVRIVVGNAGDHALLQQLLVQAYQCPLAEDFQSRLDEPSYEPCDRLLVKRDSQVIGQVQISKSFGWFGGQRCPLAVLHDFVMLPEFRAANFDQPLLEAAESAAAAEDAVLAVVRTDRPDWFEQHGWSAWRGQGHTRANTRAILSHLDAPQSQHRKRHARLEVRTWRHFELDKIQPLYEQLAPSMWGALQRCDQTWRWLVGRRAQDQILIAVEKDQCESADRLSRESPQDVRAEAISAGNEFEEDRASVVGYAVVRDSCIVEMLSLPGYEVARLMLVTRACRDAIDRDHHFVSLHTPAADPMHELLVTAGGSWISDGATSGGRWMAKLLAPDQWIKRLYPVLHERARESAIPRPLEIDFAVGDTRRRLTLTRHNVRLAPAPSSTSPQVRCDRLTFQNLLASNLTLAEASASGRLQTSHDSLLHTLAALFPPRLFWQSPFPLLRL